MPNYGQKFQHLTEMNDEIPTHYNLIILSVKRYFSLPAGSFITLT
jgi:hypothetical protein